MSIIFLLALAS